MSEGVQASWRREPPRVASRSEEFESEDGADRAPTEVWTRAELARRLSAIHAAERGGAPTLARVAPPRVRSPEVVDPSPLSEPLPVEMAVGVVVWVAGCFLLFVAGTVATVAIG